MKISKKCDYALRAMMTLVENYGNGPLSIRQLAQRNVVPKRFLEHILLDLKAKGWVTSVPGKHGGYLLAKSPDQITLGEIVRYFDGLLAPIACVSVTHYQPCPIESGCRFRRLFLMIRNEAAALLDRTSLRQAYQGKPVKRQEIFDEALVEGAGI
ncbi:MAG: Rrf2 family transcriptional regulator [Anaerolineales bacterium]|nr:Rrf2 family transcriptional regulator [Anaerolineales bacterium]MCS7246714.1 Rrf2 family transcriptional regulator [Anaerolineales bacterium]MDW8160524.1 Rrf2 family transcriptional regulator [Anaerolineales bacterium]MDW8446317.1 Rrf2 family transcriptional regulator [Anaerolineales bacterium]